MLFGGGMIALIALLGFELFFLSHRTDQAPTKYLQFKYRIIKISFVITLITLGILSVFFQSYRNLMIAPFKDPQIWVQVILPCFVIVHGMAGLISIHPFRRNNTWLLAC